MNHKVNKSTCVGNKTQFTATLFLKFLILIVRVNIILKNLNEKKDIKFNYLTSALRCLFINSLFSIF